MPRRDPQLAPQAVEDLTELDFLARHDVTAQLRGFWDGAVSPDQIEEIEELLVAPREPPWRLLRLPEHAVVIRRLSHDELRRKRLTTPTLLVARIVRWDRVDEALQNLPSDDG